MKVTFPHMGTAYIAFRALVEGLGHEAVVPPFCTQKTLNLGTRYSPESACLPLKINIGNYLEAAELGAEAIIMAGGVGPCRFGFYAYVQQEILRDLGCGMEMVILEPPASGWRQLLARIKLLTEGVSPSQIARTLWLFWEKLVACDRLEQLSLTVRPYEIEKGSTTKALYRVYRAVDRANTVDMVRKAFRDGMAELHSVPQDRNRPVLTVGLVGEIYTILEPFVNFRLQEQLGEMGVVVRRNLWLSSWILDHLVLSAFRRRREAELLRWAKPYLHHFVGGHGLESVAHSVQLAHEGVDGIIHILPFTCMPEIVAQSILPSVSEDHQLPILTVVVDEHTGMAGIRTRLEAFIDLLAGKKAVFRRCGIEEAVSGAGWTAFAGK